MRVGAAWLGRGDSHVLRMEPQPYPSDLNDEEWAIPAPLLVPGRRAGHPRVFEPRRVADAAFYLLRTGCQWRALPGPRSTAT